VPANMKCAVCDRPAVERITLRTDSAKVDTTAGRNVAHAEFASVDLCARCLWNSLGKALAVADPVNRARLLRHILAESDDAGRRRWLTLCKAMSGS